MKFNFLIIVCTVLLLSCKSKKQSGVSENTQNTSADDKKQSVVVVEVVEGLNLGNKAPEIIQAAPEGHVYTLSSFKGKMVLIDFWASWCAPCRAENPLVVSAYKKFHNSEFKNGKGLEILSVSLDQNAAAWKKAIQKDSLYWPTHVSDLQGWNNAAAIKYGVNSIPTNYLINGNGIIIAKGLRGEALEKALNEQVK